MNPIQALARAQKSKSLEDINSFYEISIDHFSNHWHTLAAAFFKNEYKEVVQDFIVNKYMHKNKLHQYPVSSDQDLLRYSCVMLKHHCIDRYSKATRRREKLENLRPNFFNNARLSSPENSLIIGMDIEDAFKSFKEKNQKRALLLYLKGHSYREIAEEMNTSENSIRNLIFRARKYFKNSIKK